MYGLDRETAGSIIFAFIGIVSHLSYKHHSWAVVSFSKPFILELSWQNSIGMANKTSTSWNSLFLVLLMFFSSITEADTSRTLKVSLPYLVDAPKAYIYKAPCSGVSTPADGGEEPCYLRWLPRSGLVRGAVGNCLQWGDEGHEKGA